MPWIDWIDERDATGRLKELFDRHGRRGRGRGTPGVDHILKIHALNPESLEHHYRLYDHLMRGPSPLSRAEREMLAVVVSRANDCHY